MDLFAAHFIQNIDFTSLNDSYSSNFDCEIIERNYFKFMNKSKLYFVSL